MNAAIAIGLGLCWLAGVSYAKSQGEWGFINLSFCGLFFGMCFAFMLFAAGAIIVTIGKEVLL